MKIRIIILSAVWLLSLLFGCKKQEEIAPASSPKADAEAQHTQMNPVGVTIDPLTGQPTANNYIESEIEDPKREPKKGGANARIGNRIIAERIVRVGTAPFAALEVDGIITGAGEVLTGIGLRVDGDRVTTLRVRSRTLNMDGSMGASVTRNFGSAPFAPLEVWFEVPRIGGDFVITGIGTRVVADNVVNLRVTYKRLKPTHLLEGSFVASVGAMAGAFTEAQFTTGISDKHVITGVGFTCSVDNITTMKVIVGELTVPIVNILQLRIFTGGDDLRGGNDNVYAHIHYRNGTIQTIHNINRSERYPDWSERIATLTLNSPTAINQISHVRLQTTFTGGISGDNWNLNRLEITAFGSDLPGGLPTIIYNRSGSPLFRFTGDVQIFSASF